MGFLGTGALIVFANLSHPESSSNAFTDPDVALMRLIKLEEKRSTISYRNSSGTVQNSNKHVLALTFKTLGQNVVSTSGGATGGLPAGSSTSTSGTTVSPTTGTTSSPTTGMLTTGSFDAQPLETLEPLTEYQLPPPTTGTTSTSLTTGTTGTTGGGSETFHGYYFYVESPGEMAPIGSRLPTAYGYWSGIPDLAAGLRIQFYPGEEVTVHLASEAALSAGSIRVAIEHYTLIHYFDNPFTPQNEEYWDASSDFKGLEYDIEKYLCQDSSIDTRKAFGQPNREGELPDDPNALPAALNFSASVWKGGSFVGNMPWQTRDQSGLARAQIYPQGTSGRSGPPRMAALSMFYRGTAPNVTNAVTIAAFTPDSLDTNFSVSSTIVTWDSKWDVQPRTTPGNPRDASKDPIFKVPFASNTPVGEYATWTLTDTTGSSSTTPATVMSAIALAIADEPDFLTNSSSAWRYFAGDTFPGQVANTFPNNDSMPRLWVVDYVSDWDDYIVWSQWWQP